MYSVIEYYKDTLSKNDNKEIAVHYYTNNVNKAINYASDMVKKFQTDHAFDYVIDVTNENNPSNFIYVYTSLDSYVKIFTCVHFENFTNDQMRQKMDPFKNETIFNMVQKCYGVELIEKYDMLKDEKVGDIPIFKIKEILAEMAISQKFSCDFGPNIQKRADKLFAVIQLPELL